MVSHTVDHFTFDKCSESVGCAVTMGTLLHNSRIIKTVWQIKQGY